jgi:hypothetical protein
LPLLQKARTVELFSTGDCRYRLANPVEQAGSSKLQLLTATSADSHSEPASVLNPIQNPKGSTFGSEKMIGNWAVPQLTEEELERVVGGYIGETEKNRN